MADHGATYVSSICLICGHVTRFDPPLNEMELDAWHAANGNHCEWDAVARKQ